MPTEGAHPDPSTPGDAAEGGGRTLRRAYFGAASLTFNTIVLFLAVNLAVGAAYLVLDQVVVPPAPVDSRLTSYRQRFADLEAYTRISAEDANELLDEQDAKGSRGFRFDPWMEFHEPPFQGRLLNVDARGFRRTTAPAPRPGRPVSVFVFGGSTTFGYGVPDDHTIPSYLQAALERKAPGRAIQVRNLGQGFYYSSQELALFIELVKAGEVPEHAVFIDGGNDLSQLAPLRDEPVFAPVLEWMWNARDKPAPPAAGSDYSWIPVVRAGRAVAKRLGLLPAPAAGAGALTPPDQNRPLRGQDSTPQLTAARVEYVVSRYWANLRMRRAICREYGIKCTFVWQPHVSYKYDRSLHKNFPFPGEIPSVYGAVFGRLATMKADDYLYLGDMFEGVKTKIFVDDVHYNEEWNERIAGRIAAVLRIDQE